jgi:hypothetical protein
VAALQEFRKSEAYDAFQQVLEAEGQLLVDKLLIPQSVEEANFARGMLFAYKNVYNVVDRILTTAERKDEQDEQRRNERPADHVGRFWGSPYYRGRFSK